MRELVASPERSLSNAELFRRFEGQTSKELAARLERISQPANLQK